MKRPMLLANSGWYPTDSLACYKEIQKYIDHDIYIEGFAPVAAIVPHSNWMYCGRLTINIIRMLREKNGRIDRIFIFGGHLLDINIPLLETFDEVDTPFGILRSDTEVRDYIKNTFNVQPADIHKDNSIEILLPIIRYFFGAVKIIPFYLPPTIGHKHIIENLYEKYGKKSLFIASTDLTHYGDNYNFYYKKNDMTPLQWVTNVNDKKYLQLIKEMKAEESVKYAIKKTSACSPGAAYAAMIAAKQAGVKEAHFVDYVNSYDVYPDNSFVTYAGFIM